MRSWQTVCSCGRAMKASTALVLGGLLWTGCATEDPTADDGDSSQLDEVIARHCDDHDRLPNHVPMLDGHGVFTTVSSQGGIDLNNEFFQDLGSNGRRCVSCHVPTVGWTITPGQLKTVFEQTEGGAYDDG